MKYDVGYKSNRYGFQNNFYNQNYYKNNSDKIRFDSKFNQIRRNTHFELQTSHFKQNYPQDIYRQRDNRRQYTNISRTSNSKFNLSHPHFNVSYRRNLRNPYPQNVNFPIAYSMNQRF